MAGQQGPSPLGSGGEMMMQFGMQYGQKALSEGESTLSKFINIGELRQYFRVNNEYVKGKLGVLLIPFGRNFVRKRCDFSDDSGNAKGGEYYPPVDDLFAPDLYIPTMAVITFTILAAFAHGMTHHAVPPEILAGAITSVLCWMAIEVLAVKVARYVLSLSLPIATFDLVALSGYKFPGICLVVFLRTVLPLETWIFTVLAVLFATTTAFFNYMSYHDMFSRGASFQNRALPICYAIALFQYPMYLWFCSWPF